MKEEEDMLKEEYESKPSSGGSMEKYDAVELINDEMLKSKRIVKGSQGVLLDYHESIGEWLVLFANIYNIGEYAFAHAKEDDLKCLGKVPEKIAKDFESLRTDANIEKYVAFQESKIKEYDWVELITDRPEYAAEGVYKGMQGTVMSSYALMGQWQVIFSEDNTARDIADIPVKEEDLKIIG